MKNSGKSKSNENPNGVRRKRNNKELAPKSLRTNGQIKYLESCSDEQLKEAEISR